MHPHFLSFLLRRLRVYLGEYTIGFAHPPLDVITLLLGNAAKTDGSYRSVTEYIPFLEQTGLVPFAYEPAQIPMGIDDLATLASMILSGKRIVIFMDYTANQTAVPWVLDEFSQMWETPFVPTNRDFHCTVQRPPNLPEEEARTRLYLFNHNLNYEIKSSRELTPGTANPITKCYQQRNWRGKFGR